GGCARGPRVPLVHAPPAGQEHRDDLGLDGVWTCPFAGNRRVPPVAGDLEVVTSKLLQPTVESATYNDKLYALPQNTNAQLLYRNTDIIKDVPENWDALVEKCKEVKDQDCLTATLKQYEGLTVMTDSFMRG